MTGREYILERVDIDPVTGCWVWNRARYKNGYGACYFSGVYFKAHRLAYREFVGPLEGLVICHSCDNRACCNPDHLVGASQTFNMRDMAAKGRCASTKLTPAQVLSIRERADAGEQQRLLAREFKVSDSAISRIVRRESWVNLGEQRK